MGQAPSKTAGVGFLCLVSSAKLKSRHSYVRDDVPPPCSDDVEVKELVAVFLSARLSSSRSILFNKRPGR